MSSAQKPPINWWNSEHQKPPESEADEIMPPISDGWFLTKARQQKTSNVVVHNQQMLENFNSKARWKFFLLLIIFSLPKDFKDIIKKTCANSCAHRIKQN